MNSSNFPLGHFKVHWFLFLSMCAAHHFVSGKSSASGADPEVEEGEGTQSGVGAAMRCARSTRNFFVANE